MERTGKTHDSPLTRAASANRSDPRSGRVNGQGGNDTLLGQWGNDRLIGSGGNDLLSGHSGNDLLLGGSGDDRLDGGGGQDRLWGGTGADSFLFRSGGRRDVILDFDPAEDRLAYFGGRAAYDHALAGAEVVRGDLVLEFRSGDQVILRGVGHVTDIDQWVTLGLQAGQDNAAPPSTGPRPRWPDIVIRGSAQSQQGQDEQHDNHETDDVDDRIHALCLWLWPGSGHERDDGQDHDDQTDQIDDGIHPLSSLMAEPPGAGLPGCFRAWNELKSGMVPERGGKSGGCGRVQPRGSQPSPASVVSLGLYSALTQPAYPSASSCARKAA